MRVLLDTHVFLWWLYESSRLSARVCEVLADGSNTLLFSSASVWALIIKIQSGKLRIPEQPEAFIVGRLALHSMDSLCVKLEHAVRVEKRRSPRRAGRWRRAPSSSECPDGAGC